jgi:hypothetical protein
MAGPERSGPAFREPSRREAPPEDAHGRDRRLVVEAVAKRAAQSALVFSPAT